jgi:hypothetical protein
MYLQTAKKYFLFFYDIVLSSFCPIQKGSTPQAKKGQYVYYMNTHVNVKWLKSLYYIE